ncbi:MAG: Holliday junction resolvase [Candidatus Helarchaeota archaeon]|nr:Holliday junction resolvase [Candidatus Helarchaeota archaeon]
MTKKSGIAAERKLVNLFWKHNFAAIRIPASGAGGKSYPKPDIIAGNGKKYYAFEVKTSNLEKIYLRDDEIQELVSFSEAFGCVPFVAIKFKKKSRDWKFFNISTLKKTTSGNNYKIEYNEDFSKGIDLSSLVQS